MVTFLYFIISNNHFRITFSIYSRNELFNISYHHTVFNFGRNLLIWRKSSYFIRVTKIQNINFTRDSRGRGPILFILVCDLSVITILRCVRFGLYDFLCISRSFVWEIREEDDTIRPLNTNAVSFCTTKIETDLVLSVCPSVC